MKMPASEMPVLFDRVALAAHRSRANGEAFFLHHFAVDEVQDRLAMVNRTFKTAAVVTAFPEPWQSMMPEAQIVADDDVLAFEPESNDLIIHAMALHWANDPVGQLIQCRRALRPDGLLIALCLGGDTLHQLRAVLSQAEVEVTGGLSPRIAPMGEIRDLGALLQRAGFALPVADSAPLTATYSDLRHLMLDLRAMGETNAMLERPRRFTRKSVFSRAQDLYSEHFAQADGRLEATFEIICLTGWAPHENQPKPLRPGSAQARLAEALGTDETKLTD
ncbi:methyltransferase domain-containing protein [Lutimaribacter marinistellae]|uniref:Methyltransferase domain-containing protein n=1 Tax=Lutimaribacter marinistellae TaxID=1820329 RepID=A0ABV7TGI7_9RHOB